MPRQYNDLTLLSDLGHADGSVGVLRGIIADLAGHVRINDLSHDVAPADVRGASVLLARAVSYLPSGVVAVVVDAGVLSDRRAIAIEVADGEGIFVGPDNGVLAPAVAMTGGAQRAVVLNNTDWHLPSPGSTWPGRDVITAVAAHLCNGVALDDLGSPVDPAILLPGVIPLSRSEGDAVIGDVLSIDRTGAVQLNVDPADIDHWGPVVNVASADHQRVAHRVGHRAPGLAAGALGFITDAYGMVTIVGAERSAAAELAVTTGNQLTLSRLEPSGTPNAVAASTSAPITLRTAPRR